MSYQTVTLFDVMDAAVNRRSPDCLRCLKPITWGKRLSATRCHECWAIEMTASDLLVKTQYGYNWTRVMTKNAPQFDRLYMKCLVVNGVKFKD